MTVEPMLETVVLALTLFILSYFLVINSLYISVTALAVGHLRRHDERSMYQPVGEMNSNQFLPEVAIIVPAYNEANVVVDSVRSLLSVEYPMIEVVVVNDGSTDETGQRLISAFKMEEIDAQYPIELPTEPVDTIYRSPTQSVTLINKANGGKADALNAGVFFIDQPLFCAVDADSIIERGALKAVVEPFLTEPTRMVATGGAVRIANGTTFRKGVPDRVRLSKNRLVRSQAVEYLRAFLLGRVGFSRLRSLLIISGAFGLFRTDVVREIGGYNTDSVTEDFELVVRLHRHLLETDRPYEVQFLSQPVVWTEAPESVRALSRQRRRWYRGLLDTLVRHRRLIGRPSYGMVGLFALPFFVIAEALGPLIEAGGYLFIPVLFLLGIVELPFFLAFWLVAIGLSAILTALSVFGEVVTYRRYDRPSDIAVLLWYSVIEALAYRPWRAFVSCRGAVEYLTGDRTWGEMTRVGFENGEDENR